MQYYRLVYSSRIEHLSTTKDFWFAHAEVNWDGLIGSTQESESKWIDSSIEQKLGWFDFNV